MKQIFSHPHRPKQKLKSETIRTEITDWQHRPLQLPRHISVPEIKTYRGTHANQIDYIPRACPLDNSQPAQTNLAWDLLKYQLSDRAAQQQHLANLRSNLQHRLQVAQAKGDRKLVDILQDEFQQLETAH